MSLYSRPEGPSRKRRRPRLDAQSDEGQACGGERSPKSTAAVLLGEREASHADPKSGVHLTLLSFIQRRNKMCDWQGAQPLTDKTGTVN